MNQLIIDLEITTNMTGPFATLAEFMAADQKPTAVLIDSDENIEDIREFASTLSVIALNFPSFLDGRAYSSANLLRREYGYKAELRAVGDIRIDQLEQMARCGFNAFQLADGQNIEQGLERLQGFSFSYQPAFNREPIFRARVS
ncbi:DUF934 domain-containing protein [Gammaproteobacteria bacterium]|nr:DUF934 domain-containing protein [Gammaproteobacteria bacterium]